MPELGAHRAADEPAAPLPYARNEGPGAGRTGVADILALGFGTAGAMWALGFLGRLPGATLPSWTLFVLLLGALLAGGFAAGHWSTRGVRGGLYAGLLAGTLNLLILGSLLASGQPNHVSAAALWWVPGSLLLSMLLATAGALAGIRTRPRVPATPSWPAVFALVAAGLTLILLAIGGSVTGYDYGLAVVDWPNTEGYNMFLYPLARMTGGIYYEHSHRLIGSLVGLTTLVLTIYLQAAEWRRGVRVLAWLALALVVTQGILGGLRVTGRFTFSTNPNDTAPNIALAIVHGVVGQVFLALLVALAVSLSWTWVRRRHAVAALAPATDHVFAIVLVALLLVQLVFGALVRHLTPALEYFRYGLATSAEQLVQQGTWALHVHIALAVLLTLLSLNVGVRLWGLHGRSAVLRRLGIALLSLVGVQVSLGVMALLKIGSGADYRPAGALDVLITTGHQIVGAALLAVATAGVLLSYRLLVSASAVPPAATVPD